MKYASDFRCEARSALSGNWTPAVLAGFLVGLLGGSTSSSGGFNVNVNIPSYSSPEQLPYDLNSQLIGHMISFFLGILLIAYAIAAVFLVLSSFVQVGYAQFNLDLVSHRKAPDIGTLFRYSSYWQTTFVASFLRNLYVFLWSLLFIIPGIVASYSYAMTPYILAENPTLTASEAIEKSKAMMYGNRWRLFCLEFSFIGWSFLCVFTLGIGFLWLRPYEEAAYAAFYREISGTGETSSSDIM